MKKLLLVIMIMVYGLSSSGMTFYLHYCCGKLDKIKVVANKEDSCHKNEGISKTKCCFDRQVDLKIKTDQESIVSGTNTFKISINHQINFNDNSIDWIPNPAVQSFNKVRGSPDHFSNRPIYLSNCIFRI